MSEVQTVERALFQVLAPQGERWETWCEECAAFILYPHDKRPASLPRRWFTVDGWRVAYVRPGSLTALNAPETCQPCREQITELAEHAPQEEPDDREPSAEQERAWNEQYDGTSFGA